jgi:hypothetical protein
VYDKVEFAEEVLDAEDNRSDLDRRAQDDPATRLGGPSPA